MKEKIKVNHAGYLQFEEELEKRRRLFAQSGNEQSKSAQAINDGWHDNFDYEQAMNKERMITQDIKKMLGEKALLEIIPDEQYDATKVNINDILKLKITYAKDDIEIEEIKLTGNYLSNTNGKIKEITLNSPLGNALYLKPIKDKVTYFVGENKIEVEILERKQTH